MKISTQNMTMGVFTVFIFAVINVLCKVIDSIGLNPLLFTSLSLFFAGFFLICIGGPNYHSIKILRSPATWLYGVTSVATVATFIHLVHYVTPTEAIMVMRLWIIIGLIISYVFYHRKTLIHYGIIFVFAGSIYVFTTINKESLGIVISLVILISLIQSTQYFALEYQKKYAKVKSEGLSVMGYILLATSLLFLIFIIFSSLLNDYIGYSSEFIPTVEDVFNLKMFFVAPVFGILGFSLLRTMEFKTVTKVGADVFMLFTALTPLFTLIVEIIFSYLIDIKTMDITTPFIISNVLVVFGSFISAYDKLKNNKEKRLAPKARAELDVLRDTIKTAYICFNNDEDKIAKALGVGKRTLTKIITKDEKVKKSIRDKIIFNHAKKVAGLDYLTGALNKTSFELRLKDLENKDQALVIFIDLNKFKPVNDTYGHDAGDSLLEGIAYRLMDEFTDPHVVARLGGDEYCLIIYGAREKDGKKYIKRIKEIVEEPFILEGVKEEVSVGCSIGAVHYPEDGNNGIKLQKIADKRMYQNKVLNPKSR